jgi:hypothetical protein
MRARTALKMTTRSNAPATHKIIMTKSRVRMGRLLMPRGAGV